MKNPKTQALKEAERPLIENEQPSAPPMPIYEASTAQVAVYHPPPPQPPPMYGGPPHFHPGPAAQGVPYPPAPGYGPPPPGSYPRPPILVTPELSTCGHCGTVGVPARVKGTGLCTWMTCGALCGLGLWPCAPCVFCFDCTKDDVYICPRCMNEIGRERVPGCLN